METRILKVLSFISIIGAYTLHPLLWESAFYHLTAFCFVTLTRIVWKKTYGKWKLVSLIMHVTACNNFIDELFFDPTKIDLNEYLTLIITVVIVYYNRSRWMK